MDLPDMKSIFQFFFNDPAPTEIYTLSLHDALPISLLEEPDAGAQRLRRPLLVRAERHVRQDRKSTRLNSSHMSISYAVFCLKKKTSIPRSYDVLPPCARGSPCARNLHWSRHELASP